jgi:hypothetical protein
MELLKGIAVFSSISALTPAILDIGPPIELSGKVPALLLANGLLCVALFNTGFATSPVNRSAT